MFRNPNTPNPVGITQPVPDSVETIFNKSIEGFIDKFGKEIAAIKVFEVKLNESQAMLAGLQRISTKLDSNHLVDDQDASAIQFLNAKLQDQCKQAKNNYDCSITKVQQLKQSIQHYIDGFEKEIPKAAIINAKVKLQEKCELQELADDLGKKNVWRI